MTVARRVLLLHDASATSSDLEGLVTAMRAQGAEVEMLACAEPYDSVLDALAKAQTVVYWR